MKGIIAKKEIKIRTFSKFPRMINRLKFNLEGIIVSPAKIFRRIHGMKEKMVADELQSMFLEGLLPGVKEEFVNVISKNLRTGEITIKELLHDHSNLKEKVAEALNRIPSYIWI